METPSVTTSIKIALDFGNSALKVFSEAGSSSFAYKTNWVEEAKKYINGLSEKPLISCSSVNRKKLDEFVVKSRIVIKQPASLLLEKQSILDYSGIEGIGQDRLLGLIAGLNFSGRKNVVTVDFGTAVTVNFAGRNGRCYGGAILPGAYTQAKMLADYADALPEIDLHEKPQIPAGTTAEAINSGIIFGVAGAVNKLISKGTRKLRWDGFDIYITGGYSGIVRSYLEFIYEQRDYLVCEGLLSIMSE